jgi:hypothetical protein
MASIVFETTQLTLGHIEHWRGEPGLGVQHLDNVLKQDPEARILQMIVIAGLALSSRASDCPFSILCFVHFFSNCRR